MHRLRRNLKRKGQRKREVTRTVRVRQLDPVEMCGQGTSVRAIYRVEERLDDARLHHLVFLDRHGWYCEHGKQCSVVKDVQKFSRSRT